MTITRDSLVKIIMAEPLEYTALGTPSVLKQAQGIADKLLPIINDETGWLIEHRRSQPCEPEYWAGNGWSKDHMLAIRFARQIDAERTRDGFEEDDPLPDEQPHRVCEHGWS